MRSFWHLIDSLPAPQAQDYAQWSAWIWKSYGVRRCVMTLDMSGFSLQVHEGDLLQVLAQIRKMQQLLSPLVVRHGGQVVKFEADNMAAVFPDCASGALCAAHLHAACAQASNAGRPLMISIGLDWGELLLIPHQDLYGDCVNQAFKLGEDCARGGETLVTEAVRQELDEADWQLSVQQLNLPGLMKQAYRLERRLGR